MTGAQKATQTTLKALIAEALISLQAERTEVLGPRWKVVLLRSEQRRTKQTPFARMTMYFPGAEAPPTAEAVLIWLFAESDAARNRDFADWASDPGEKLKAFLGPELFERMRSAER